MGGDLRVVPVVAMPVGDRLRRPWAVALVGLAGQVDHGEDGGDHRGGRRQPQGTRSSSRRRPLRASVGDLGAAGPDLVAHLDGGADVVGDHRAHRVGQLGEGAEVGAHASRCRPWPRRCR